MKLSEWHSQADIERPPLQGLKTVHCFSQSQANLNKQAMQVSHSAGGSPGELGAIPERFWQLEQSQSFNATFQKV